MGRYELALGKTTRSRKKKIVPKRKTGDPFGTTRLVKGQYRGPMSEVLRIACPNGHNIVVPVDGLKWDDDMTGEISFRVGKRNSQTIARDITAAIRRIAREREQVLRRKRPTGRHPRIVIPSLGELVTDVKKYSRNLKNRSRQRRHRPMNVEEFRESVRKERSEPRIVMERGHHVAWRPMPWNVPLR